MKKKTDWHDMKGYPYALRPKGKWIVLETRFTEFPAFSIDLRHDMKGYPYAVRPFSAELEINRICHQSQMQTEKFQPKP